MNESKNNSSTPVAPGAITIESEAMDASSDGGESWRYHPEEINAYYNQHLWQVSGRFINIVVSFAVFFISLWWDRTTNTVEKHERQRGSKLRKILTRLGPTYIKIGQALSTRPDLVSPVYLDELTILQDQLPSFSNEIAHQFIKEELGSTPELIFAYLSPEPIAAAHNENILPLRLPFSSFENVLLKNGLLKLPFGDMINSAGYNC